MRASDEKSRSVRGRSRENTNGCGRTGARAVGTRVRAVGEYAACGGRRAPPCADAKRGVSRARESRAGSAAPQTADRRLVSSGARGDRDAGPGTFPRAQTGFPHGQAVRLRRLCRRRRRPTDRASYPRRGRGKKKEKKKKMIINKRNTALDRFFSPTETREKIEKTTQQYYNSTIRISSE